MTVQSRLLVSGSHQNPPDPDLLFASHDICEQNFHVIHSLLKIKILYIFIFNSGNEETEGILPQVRHGSAWRYQGGDLFCKTAPRSPSER